MNTGRRLSLTLVMLAVAELIAPLSARAAPPPGSRTPPAGGTSLGVGATSPQPIGVPQTPPSAPAPSTGNAEGVANPPPTSSSAAQPARRSARLPPIPGGAEKNVVTRNRLFVIPKDAEGTSFIYVKKDLSQDRQGFPRTAPFRLKRDEEKVFSLGNHQYFRYEVSCPGVRDCLHTAEELMQRKTLRPEAGEIYSKEKLTGKDFGDDETEGGKPLNRVIAEAALAQSPNQVNIFASPQVGEAYAIVRQKAPEAGESPYHAAAVVARDGNDTVTLELSAGDEDGVKRDTAPRFFTQNVGSADTSFHAQMKRVYGRDTAITIVLQPK